MKHVGLFEFLTNIINLNVELLLLLFAEIRFVLQDRSDVLFDTSGTERKYTNAFDFSKKKIFFF